MGFAPNISLQNAFFKLLKLLRTGEGREIERCLLLLPIKNCPNHTKTCRTQQKHLAISLFFKLHHELSDSDLRLLTILAMQFFLSLAIKLPSSIGALGMQQKIDHALQRWASKLSHGEIMQKFLSAYSSEHRDTLKANTDSLFRLRPEPCSSSWRLHL